jgi:hypothetical protein
MFKNVASDVLGLSDIGKIIAPKDYHQADSDDYILHEDGEKIYFLIKSKSDEYCFTNFALLHLDGSSATSKKRLLKRYNYKENYITNVTLETAGTVDLDIEIKFHLGNESYSIDVDKKDIDRLKDLYKALLKIGSIQKENNLYLEYAHKSLDLATSSLKSYNNDAIAEQFKEINSYTFKWLKSTHQEFTKKDFGDVFEKYINQ